MSQPEVRKLPKKTIIIISILIFLFIVGFLFINFTKQAKMEEVLSSHGYKNVSDVIVYNVSQVQDDATNKQGSLYKIGFTNLDTKQKCMGLIFKISGGYKKDIECK